MNPPARESRPKDHQRTDHDHRGFMDMFFGVMVHAGRAIERQIGQAEHVEGGQKRADGGHAVQHDSDDA